MIANFPQASRAISKAMKQLIQKRVSQTAPMLAFGKKKTLHEGNRMSVLHSNGKYTVDNLSTVKGEFQIHEKEVPHLQTEDIIAKVSTMADDMAGQMERNLIDIIDKSTKESGNVITGNKELGLELILKALEQISIDFEDDDRMKPIKPSIIAHPDNVKQLFEIEKKLTEEQKEGYKQREKEIMDKKYREHLEDLESRKIID